MVRQMVRVCGLVLLLVLGPAWAEAQTISGRVQDQRTGGPLSAVQVSIADLDIGTLTASNGTYTITSVPPGTHTVRAQLIGYAEASTEVTVSGGGNVIANFVLREQPLELDAIVVTGTAGGSQRRAIGNVVSELDAAQITEVAPVATVEDLISGRVPGVVSVPGSGVVGADATLIRVRSSTSPTLAGNPLVYVDGVRINSDVEGQRDRGVSRLNDINPNDIESIEIIKGPAASTLYGTEAANGVIQIITKRGQTGAPRFDIFTEWGASWLGDVVPVNYGRDPGTGEVLSMHLPTAEEERGTPVLQNGLVRRQGIAVRGATDRVRYFASYNQGYQEGVISWNNEGTDAGRLNVGVTANDGLDLDLSISYSNRKTRFDRGFWASLSRGTPLDANTISRGWDDTPEQMRDQGEDWAEAGRLTVSLTAMAQPFSWLESRLTLGTDRADVIGYSTEYRREADDPYGFEEGERDVDDNTSRFQSVDLSTTASLDLTPSAGSETSVGFQYNKRRDWARSASGEEFASPVLSTVGATARTTGSESYEENTGVGVYVQEQLDWENRIFLTGAVRMDDNSAFGQNFDAAIYPKVSATWVAHEEDFFNVDFLSTLRLRGAWGAAGRQPDLFDRFTTFVAITGANDLPALTPDGFGNPDLGPERSTELELGFDAGLFDERVAVQFTQYWRRTTDAIVETPLSPSLGYPGSLLQNVGRVDGWGSEAQVDVQVLNRSRLRWSVGLGMATMHSEIKDLGGVSRIPVRRGRQHIEGYPIASVHNIRIVSADFVSGSSGRVTNILCDPGGGPDGHQPTDLPGVPCSEANLIYQGPGEPTWNFSFTSNVTLYDALQIFANVDGRGGNTQHVDGIAARHTSWSNSLARTLADDPIFMAYTQTDRARLATFDASYLRLREVGVRYQIPDGLASRVKASSLSLAVAARNLPYLWRANKRTTIGNEPIPSPEVVITTERFFGESHSSMPPPTAFTATLRVSF